MLGLTGAEKLGTEHFITNTLGRTTHYSHYHQSVNRLAVNPTRFLALGVYTDGKFFSPSEPDVGIYTKTVNGWVL